LHLGRVHRASCGAGAAGVSELQGNSRYGSPPRSAMVGAASGGGEHLMHALEQRPAHRGLVSEALSSYAHSLTSHPFLVTAVAALGALFAVGLAAALTRDAREAGVYAVACLMIGGGIVLGRRAVPDEAASALEAERDA